MPDVSTLTLNNGVVMPALGFGVFQTPPDETRTAVSVALEAGYRHVDTAAAYGNERQVGDAVASSGLDRSEVFVETKIWISDYGYDQTLHGFAKSARKLGIDQIDLFILHQALPSQFAETLQAYRALERLLADGKVRAIGVSNFMVDHLTGLLDSASVVPPVNQIEVHRYFTQPEVQALNAAHGILTQAWSPIGGITFYRDGQHTSTLLDPTIGDIATHQPRRAGRAGKPDEQTSLSRSIALRRGGMRAASWAGTLVAACGLMASQRRIDLTVVEGLDEQAAGSLVSAAVGAATGIPQPRPGVDLGQPLRSYDRRGRLGARHLQR
jgi:diketogulonate reductase-like aldo/keto reductase